MERNRDAIRGSIATVNEIGLPRRRHRITAIRDSPEEEEQMRLQETERLRERQRVHKDRDRDRDRDSMSQTKRRRVDGYSRSKDRGVDDGGVEDSSAEESFDEYNGEDEATAPSFSMSNHASRRSVTPTGNRRSFPVLRVADEMIDVAVPRRARSASVRRSNQYWNSVTGGFGEEQSSYRRLSPLPLTRRVDTVSPSSSSVPLRKKMKPLGPKIQIPKASRKPLPSVQEDIEIEVVEALFDLMKQSQSLLQSQTSKKDERDKDNSSSNPTEKHDSISNKAVGHKSKNSSMHSVEIAIETSEMLPDIEDIPTALLHVGSKRKGTVYLKDEESSVAFVQEESRIGIYSSNEELESKISFSRSEKMYSDNIAQRNQELDASDEVVVPKFEEFRSSVNSNADDSANSSVSKANSTGEVIERKKEAKFEIDLMAPPPMPLSPERDGLTHVVSGHKYLGIDVQMKSGTLAANIDSLVAAKITVQNKQELLKQENTSSSGGIITQQSGQKKSTQCTLPTPATEKFAISNSLPFSIGATSWPGGLTHSGYMPPLQTIMPIDGSARSSTQLQLAPFSFSQPRPKRCVTHQYIAGNIRYLQQLTKTCMWPAAGPATLYGAKRYDFSPTPPTPNSHHGKSSQEHLPGKQALAAIPVLSAEGKSLEVANLKDAAKSEHLVFRQASPQGQVDNLLGPAFIFPLGQHLVTSLPATQSGATKSAATLVGKTSLSNNSFLVPPVGSSSFLAGPTAVSFNCSNLPANEAPPFMTLLQNNGRPYSISANSGMALQYKGAQAPTFPFFNAPYYPSVFHISQNQPQSTSQPLSDAPHQVQQVSENAGTSSSYKETKNQQEIGTRAGEHSSLNSGRMQLQQSQKQSHLSSKLDKEMSRKVIAVANSQGSCSQKTCSGQNFAIPIQPMNFAPMTCGGLGYGGNHHGKQEQQGSKYGVEIISHQTNGLPLRTSSTTPPLNFPSVSQTTAFPQLLPDVGRKGFQFIPAPLSTQYKNFQVAEEKMITNSSGKDDGKKAILGKSVGQSLSFSKLGCGNSLASTLNEIDADGSAQTRSCLASTVTGNELSPSSTAATAAFSINTKKSQLHKEQQELFQLQKQHIQQMQLTCTAKVEEPATKTSSYSLIGSFPTSIPIFFQPLAHNNNFVHPSNWKNASFAATSQVPAIAANSSHINLPRQELKNAHGEHQISFGCSSNSTINFQGQKLVINSQGTSVQVDGSSSSSSPSENTSGSGSKARPTVAALPPQQTQTYSNGPSQKPSPVCGRNVPSILGTCPSQLSDLKY